MSVANPPIVNSRASPAPGLASRATTMLTQKNPGGEIVLGIVLIFVSVLVFFTAEGLYKATKYGSQKLTYLMDYTAGSEDKALAVHQDPVKFQDAKTILFSENEPTGIEFAYSFYLFVNHNTFTGESVLHHVWHKGYGCIWPLMGPGVFIRSDTNALRVVMNTYENPYSYVDIMNIPVGKWFHVVLNCRRAGMEVYVNGNLANKIRFENTMPYQNFEDIIIFSNANFTLPSIVPALNSETLRTQGAFKGYMSSFVHARYALSYSEIQKFYNAGPSTKMKSENLTLPPYLSDGWWNTTYPTN
jgi:hypothetical protein